MFARWKRLFLLFLFFGAALGRWQMWHFLAQRFFCRAFKVRRPYRLSTKAARYPLWCRPQSSDLDVFKQIFVLHEYALVTGLLKGSSVGLVLDCGANAGYSAAYFLTQFPRCELIAVEPDAANFRLLQRNLAPYGKRARAMHSAIWSHSVGLKITDNLFRDGREWARTVRECRGDETPDFVATDIATLLHDSGHERISLLKMDIEGAETIVFNSNYEDWLSRVDNIAIELHDDSPFGPATEVFYRACAGHFSFETFDEVLIGRRIQNPA